MRNVAVAKNRWRSFELVTQISADLGCLRDSARTSSGRPDRNASVWYELAILLLAARHHHSSDQVSFSSHASHAIDPTFCLLHQCRSLRPGLPLVEWLTRPLGGTMPPSGMCSVGFSITKFFLTSHQAMLNPHVPILHESAP